MGDQTRRRCAPPRAPTTCCGPSRPGGSGSWPSSPGGPGGPGSVSCSTPCSRTPSSSGAASGTRATWCARRCTSSPTAAGGAVALRPEGTASVVRAFVQHHPPVPWKAWYVTPAFRYERPQAGRYQQHHQLGVEVLGTDDPDVDVEVIDPGRRLSTLVWGSRQVDLARQLHGVRGVPARRTSPPWSAYLDEHADRAVRRAPGALPGQPAAGPRLQEARVPGRDRGRPAASPTTSTRPAPRTWPGCAPGSTTLGVAYRLEPRLVRGLDYYTRTTFEFAADGARPRPRTPWAAAGATTGWPRPSGGRPPRASASGSASSGCCWPVTPRGASPSTRRAPDAFVVDVTGGTAARDLVRRAAPGRARGGARLRWPFAQVPAQAGGPLRGPVRAHRRAPRSSPAAS